MSTVLFLVVPCYNEQDSIHLSAPILAEKMRCLCKSGAISEKSRVMFVDDGSSDNTWKSITTQAKKNELFCGIKLKSNSGQQNAILAGYFEAAKYADAVISLDCDLQDDINAIDRMLEEYEKGNEIVYGVREDRKTDNFMKKHTALIFYRLMKLLGTRIIYNSAQFRLVSRRAIEILSEYKEGYSYLPTLFMTMGLKSAQVTFKRQKRIAGKGKFTYTKMIRLALDAVVSSSKSPISFITGFAGLSFITALVNFICFLVCGTEKTWLMVCAAVWFSACLILGGIRIIGEYIGNMFSEVKGRPRYIIDATTYGLMTNGSQNI